MYVYVYVGQSLSTNRPTIPGMSSRLSGPDVAVCHTTKPLLASRRKSMVRWRVSNVCWLLNVDATVYQYDSSYDQQDQCG